MMIEISLEQYNDMAERLTELEWKLGEAVEVVRCKDCRYANECHKSVQYTRHELNTVTIGYSPIEWCSRGERKGGDPE